MRQADAIAAGAARVAPAHEARLLRAAQVRGVTQLEEECARIRAAAAAGHAVAEPTLPLEGVEPPRPVPVARKIIVRVDLDTLLRGWPIDAETCDIPGIGPLPVQAVRAMLRTGNAILAAVITRSEQVVAVAHLGRVPSAHQQTVLEWLGARCAVQGCDRTVGLERDHRTPWAHTNVILVDDLDRLCTPHHQLNTHHHWALLDGTGIRPFVPPDDPRHPDPHEARGDPDEPAG